MGRRGGRTHRRRRLGPPVHRRRPRGGPPARRPRRRRPARRRPRRHDPRPGLHRPPRPRRRRRAVHGRRSGGLSARGALPCRARVDRPARHDGVGAARGAGRRGARHRGGDGGRAGHPRLPPRRPVAEPAAARRARGGLPARTGSGRAACPDGARRRPAHLVGARATRRARARRGGGGSGCGRRARPHGRHPRRGGRRDRRRRPSRDAPVQRHAALSPSGPPASSARCWTTTASRAS